MSGTGNLHGTIPAPVTPIADGQGNVAVAWRAWFLILQRRTGGTAGASSGDNSAAIDAERAARVAADSVLRATIDDEITARTAADEALTAAGAGAIDGLQIRIQTVTNQVNAETTRALAAEALLVPLDQLCVSWGQCDLSFLPTADPGLGRPWIDGNHVAIGSGLIPVDIGLEDGTGFWTLEGGGDWLWG